MLPLFLFDRRTNNNRNSKSTKVTDCSVPSTCSLFFDMHRSATFQLCVTGHLNKNELRVTHQCSQHVLKQKDHFIATDNRAVQMQVCSKDIAE